MRSTPLLFLAALSLGCGPSSTGFHRKDASSSPADGDAPSDGSANADLPMAPPDLANPNADLTGCNVPEICNGLDDNCDGNIDEGFDQDQDNATSCGGDCDDTDPSIRPGAIAKCNGKDNDCDGVIDDKVDKDQDGYSICKDCNDADPIVNQGAMEVLGDKVDNDCNGQIDDPPAACDANIPSNSNNAADYARAIEICQFLVSANYPTIADSRARQVASDWGIFTTRAGKNMTALSTGVAADEDDKSPAFIPNETPQEGTDFGKANFPNPLIMQATKCTDQLGRMQTWPDAQQVNDYTELKLVLQVPSNAKSFSFDFNFLSAEYPEWVCTEFNDKFLALLDSKAFKGNISFDSKGNAVTINNGFFTVTKANQLTGTGMQKIDLNGDPNGGGTDWLTTTSPVAPGEQITLRFIVFDEGDGIYDSQVLIDNFRWSLMPAMGGPGTSRPDGGL